MKAPPRPLSQKRAAEGLQGRVRRARVYVLSPAAGAARRSTPLPLRGPRAERRFRLLMRTRHGHLQEQKTLGSRLGSLY